MKTTAEIFSENLRRLLEEKKKTQKALAKFVPTTEATVSRWINGSAMPRYNMIDKICAFLMCSPEDLMLDKDRAVTLLPEDVMSEELKERPILFKLMLVAMRASDEEVSEAIQLLKK